MGWLHSINATFVRNSAVEARPLRNTFTGLKILKKSSVNGQNCFSYRGVKLWNSLPAEAKSALLQNFNKLTCILPPSFPLKCFAVSMIYYYAFSFSTPFFI